MFCSTPTRRRSIPWTIRTKPKHLQAKEFAYWECLRRAKSRSTISNRSVRKFPCGPELSHHWRKGPLVNRRDRSLWQDVDFENLVLHISRSVVAMVEGAPKTEASLKDVPLDAQTAESLWAWRRLFPYPTPVDWVFASPHMKGRQPYWPGTLWRYYGKPALQRAKVRKQVSYHTFRHTFGTLLNANGENPKVVQELLRHASLKVTTDVYMQAVGPQKLEAQSNFPVV